MKKISITITILVMSVNLMMGTFSVCKMESMSATKDSESHCSMSTSGEMSCCSMSNSPSDESNSEDSSCSVVCSCELTANLPKSAALPVLSEQQQVFLSVLPTFISSNFSSSQFKPQFSVNRLVLFSETIPIFIKVLSLRN